MKKPTYLRHKKGKCYFETFMRDMKAWVADGKVKVREDIVEGLENAPASLIGLFEGNNFGKLLVRVAK